MNRSVRIISGLTGLKILGAIAGILYSVIQVKYFGTDRVIEIYFAAQSVIYLLQSLTQSGQLAEIFLPIYLKLKKEHDPQTAHRAYSVIINRLSLYIILGLVISYFLAPLLMKAFIPGFSSKDQEMATIIYRVLLPMVLLQINNGFLNLILNAERIYGRIEVTGVINNLLGLLLITIFYKTMGVWVLVISLYTGIFIQITVSIYFAYRKKIKYYFLWYEKNFNHKSFFLSLFSTLTYTSSTQILNWAITASVSFLPQGYFAIFQYVRRLYSKITSIITEPISVVFFTSISEKIMTQKNNNLKIIIKKFQEISLIFGLFAFSAIIAGGKEVLSFLWMSKKFDLVDLNIAYNILLAFSLILAVQLFFVINRKYAVGLGNARLIYNYLSLTQFLSAITYLSLIYFWGFGGLIISIIVNRGLIVIVPFYVNIKKAHNNFNTPNKFFWTKYTLLMIVIPTSIFLIKNFWGNFILGDNRWFDLFYSALWISISSILSLGLILLFFKENIVDFKNIIKGNKYE